MTKREEVKLKEIISMLEKHWNAVDHYTKISMSKFTYENNDFSSCMMCGHSDKALIYELRKLLKETTK